MMKKKRFLILLLTSVVLVTFMITSGFDSQIVKPKNSNEPSYVAYSYISENAPKEKNITIMGKEIQLKYSRTVNDVDKLPQDRVDKYGTYDEYVDEDRNIYSYLQNSDLLCGICFMNRTGESEPLSDNEIREKAENFVKDILGIDFERYTFVNHSEDHLISYCYFVE